MQNKKILMISTVLFFLTFDPFFSASGNNESTIGAYQWKFAEAPNLATTKVIGLTHGAPGFLASAVEQKTNQSFILFSKDGKKWSVNKTSVAPENPRWGNGNFYGGVKKNIDRVWHCSIGYSKNGTQWNEISTPDFCVLDMVWDGKRYLATTVPEILESSPASIYSTLDFKKWNLEYRFDNEPLLYAYKIDYLKGTYYLSGFKGTLHISGDGKTWTRVVNPKGVLNNTSKIIWDGYKYFIPHYETGEMLFSTDTMNWTHLEAGYSNTSSGYMNLITPYNNNILYDGSYYYGIVHNEKEVCLSFSISGHSWTCAKDYLYELNRKYNPGNEMFIASGDQTVIAIFHTARYGKAATDISPVILYAQPQNPAQNKDQNWSEALIGPAGESIELHTLAANKNIYVAAGGIRSYSRKDFEGDKQGYILVSEDKIHWRKIKPEFKNRIHSIIWTEKGFYGVGLNGLIITSPDGLKWKTITTSLGDNFSGIYYTGGIFFVFGSKDSNYPTNIYTSKNGKNWEMTFDGSKEANTGFYGIASNGSNYVIALYNKILISKDGKEWKESYKFQNPKGSIKIEYLLWDGIKYNLVTSEKNAFSVDGENYKVSEPVRKVYTSDDGVNWEGYNFPQSASTPVQNAILIKSPRGTSFNTMIGYNSSEVFSAALWGGTNWNVRWKQRNDLNKTSGDGSRVSFLYDVSYVSEKKEVVALMNRNGAVYLVSWN